MDLHGRNDRSGFAAWAAEDERRRVDEEATIGRLHAGDVDDAPASAHRRRGRGRAIALAVVAAIVLWVVVGLLRGPTVGADAFAAFESPRAVTMVETTTFPPFVVHVQGTVTEAGGASYTSTRSSWSSR